MNHRYWMVLLCLAAFILITSGTAGADQCCTLKKDCAEGSYAGGDNTDYYVVSQSFTPSEDYNLCKVSVYLSSGGGTLRLQDGPTTGATVYRSAAISGGSGDGWYTADITDMMVYQAQQYFIRVTGGSLWRCNDGDPYSGGSAYRDLPPNNPPVELPYRDMIFRNYTYEECEPPPPPGGKVAVHVLPHASRTCTKNFPAIVDCADIITTEPSPDVDAFPVFFDLVEYQGFDYGLSWPGLYTCAFTSCSDLTIGGIVFSGDGVSHAWTSCQAEPVAIPAFAWIYDYGMVCVVPHPVPGTINIGDCQAVITQPGCVFCAGIGGYIGDDPCEPTATEATSWGNIKSMFK